MDALLAEVLTAHGGLERWHQVRHLTARVTLGGPFWAAKGWPDLLTDETVELDTQRQHLVYTPFGQVDRRSVFDVEPERLTVQTHAGDVIEQRLDPRASFAGYTATSPWDALQVSYFASYALWNYLTEPFLFTYPGVEAHEIEPWQEAGDTWRRLQVTFPDYIATHNAQQIFYYDAAGMQRRMDYAPVVNGNPSTAHYTDAPQSFDGIVFPTQRRVLRRNPDNTADLSRVFITIAIQAITLR